VLGSGSLVAQFARAGLIDEYEILLIPVVLVSGKSMFEGVKDRFRLKLTKSRVFGNGNILLNYEPVK
jgi:dihydrofolate reductase